MLIKTVRQNRLPFVVLTLSFIFFLGAIIFGGRAIYTLEAEQLSTGVAASLDRDNTTVQSFFLSCLRDLEFIENLQALVSIFSDGADPEEKRHDVETILLMLVKSHPHYTRISFIDKNGMERMTLQNDTGDKPFINRTGAVYRGNSECFRKTTGLSGTQFYSFFSAETPAAGAATMQATLAAPLFSAGGRKLGVISMEISVRGLLAHLSKGTFFQDSIGLQQDAPGRRQKGTFPFAGTEGMIPLSDTDSIPYRLVEYLPGFHVWMAQRFSSSPFKASMLRLEAAAVGILVVFFLSVLVIGFFNVRHLRTVNTVQKAIIHSLANLSEWRDPETGSHLERTRSFCVLLAKTLRNNPRYSGLITADYIEALYDAVPLHDIGKVGIRDDVLLKKGRLTAEEFGSMKQHVMIGRDIIQDIMDRFRLRSRFLEASRNICHYHHERYDGSGYPEGLCGEAIPLEARIFAICDVYDALRSKRPYKAGLTHRETMETIVPDRGRHFDPDVVDAFIACNERFYEIFEVYRLFDESYGRMMNIRSKDALKIKWTDDLEVGVPVIDSQHMEFIDRVNSLFAGIVLGEGKRAAIRELHFLHQYAVYHFVTEEKIMKQHGYPHLDHQRVEHAAFLANLLSLQGEMKSVEEISSDQVVLVNAKVVEWLVDHIIKSDRKFGDYLKQPSHAAEWAGNEGRPGL